MNQIMCEIPTEEKLRILADAAKYDVACTSSGVDRAGKKGALGNSVAAGICHSFAADGRCVSLLKVLFTNHCVYDCKYCHNRCSNDVERAAFEPEELCKLVIEFYKRNYIEGLFLSSGVLKSPAYTMEKICQTLYMLRNDYHFNGYIHVKTIPGAPDDLLAMVGLLADRVSINLELPTNESLRSLAPNKDFKNILSPMGKMSSTIASHRLAIGKDARMERSAINNYLPGSIFRSDNLIENRQSEAVMSGSSAANSQDSSSLAVSNNIAEASQKNSKQLPDSLAGSTILDTSKSLLPDSKLRRPFAPAGQSTQMIIGATPESDLTLLKTTQSLYKQYDLKRVFFSAYIPLNEDSALPSLDAKVPLLREHRLYQADWLLRYYGFVADEILSEDKPFLSEQIDPKCDWALRHLELFPVDLQKAPFDLILRVPGIGPKSARRIVAARRYGTLTFENIKKMGVVLKRAHYFILCNGKMMYNTPIEEGYIFRQLTATNQKENWQIAHQNEKYEQLSLFDFIGA